MKKSILIGLSKKPNGMVKNKILNSIKTILEDNHIDVNKLANIGNKNEILWIRDIFFVINDTCIICNLTSCDTVSQFRKDEYIYIMNIIKSKYKNIIYCPEHIHIEGGDIIQNDSDVFVGINERTTITAIEFLQNIFPKCNFIPVPHNCLHLDCALAIIKNKQILCLESIVDISKIPNDYLIINVEIPNINNNLTTNFLIIDDNNVIHTNKNENNTVIDILKQNKYNVHIVQYEDLWKEGGGVRCLTQWF